MIKFLLSKNKFTKSLVRLMWAKAREEVWIYNPILKDGVNERL